MPNGSAERPRARTFDSERYQLSKDLVGMLDQLITTDGRVSKTRHDNFFRLDNVVVERDGSRKDVSYFIFMSARKLEEPHRPKTLRVTVESAYPERDDIPNPVARGGRSLGEMLGEHWAPKDSRS